MQSTRTKIVATLGPASEGPETVRRLIEAGVDVFRLNFSHGSQQTHARYVRTIRQVAGDRPVAILQDLQGPRIRTGRLRGRRPVELAEGAEIALRPGDFEGDSTAVPVSYERLAADVEPGDRVLLKDGTIELEVIGTSDGEARCRVVVGGTLGEKEGVNLPGVNLSIACPTEKDIRDLRFGIEQGVDYVALSFVRAAAEIERIREEAGRCGGGGLPVVAKIEKPEAVERIGEILRASDGVMVARGDLGIEMPTDSVPVVQKRVIRAANSAGVPAITATQMLESMIDSPRPTRAEATDVANAILDGTDAVMLSGETSVGRYPVEAVRTMDGISRRIEQVGRGQLGLSPPEVEQAASPRQHALAEAACGIARRLGAVGVVAFTITGSTALYISQRRPDVPIYALTPDEGTFRRLALLWGVEPVRIEVFETTDQMIGCAEQRLKELGFVSAGDTVVYVAGASTSTPGGTDMLKIQQFRE